MTSEEMEELYLKSISFRLYVDKVCAHTNITKDKAFQDAIVKSYAEYVLNDQPKEAKEDAVREYKQNYGC